MYLDSLSSQELSEKATSEITDETKSSDVFEKDANTFTEAKVGDAEKLIDSSQPQAVTKTQILEEEDERQKENEQFLEANDFVIEPEKEVFVDAKESLSDFKECEVVTTANTTNVETSESKDVEIAEEPKQDETLENFKKNLEFIASHEKFTNLHAPTMKLLSSELSKNVDSGILKDKLEKKDLGYLTRSLDQQQLAYLFFDGVDEKCLGKILF